MSFITETTDLGSPDRKFNKIYAKELVNGIVATTQTAGDNSTKIATTAYVDNALAGKANKDRAYDLYDDFTIIYPNGGTEGNPANVTVNSRYVMDNPFSGYYVYCIAEIQKDGLWGETGWSCDLTTLSGEGEGVKASTLGTSIVVQTGLNLIMRGACYLNGGSFGITSSLTSAPCRVKVWKIGKVVSA